MKVINKYLLISSLMILSLISCKQNNKLNEDNIKDFVSKFFESQAGENMSTDDYNNSAGKDLMAWDNPTWRSSPVKFDVSNTKEEWFYEDSITFKIHDIYVINDNANVMGTAKWYSAGIETFYQNFSGIVGMENGKLVWKRHMGVWNNTLAKDFLWPSSKVEGSLNAYNKMRSHMMNLENEKALSLSDSLVKVDSTWATAHLGQLHYYSMNNDLDKKTEAYNLAMSKLETASIGESLFIKSYNPDTTVDTRALLRLAFLHAPNDPMIRTWYAWGEKDVDVALDILKKGLNRMPDNTGLNNMIGYKLMNKGDMEQAGKHFALNVASSPKVANAHDSYGDYLLKLGNKKEAKNSFLKAYEIDNSFIVSKEKADKIED
jgi:tetratricopeptide (TPR) repeat protein